MPQLRPSAAKQRNFKNKYEKSTAVLAHLCWLIKISCSFVLSKCSIIRQAFNVFFLKDTYSFSLAIANNATANTLLRGVGMYPPHKVWQEWTCLSLRCVECWGHISLSSCLLVFLAGVSDQNKDGSTMHGRIRSAVNCEPSVYIDWICQYILAFCRNALTQQLSCHTQFVRQLHLLCK